MFATIGLDDSEFSRGLSKSKSSAEAFADAAKVTFAAVGAAVSAVSAMVVKTGSEFESQMSVVKSISGATAEDMELLSEKAKYMGATTQFTAKEAAEAFEYMAMAGWKTNDMFSGLEGIMYAAGASGENLALVSDIITDGLTAFGKSAEYSGDMADILAAASSNSNTNIGMLGESFKYIAPVAGAFGFSVEDTAVSLGLMANAGIKASQAGTSFRQILMGLSGGATISSSAFGEMTISMENADGTMKPWSQTVDELRDAFSKMTESEKAANAETIAGKIGMSGLLAIVNAAPADYEKLTTAVDNYTGTAKAMNEVRLDNLVGDVTILGSAVEGLGLQIYQSFDAPLRTAAQNATTAIGELSEELAKPAMQSAIDSIGDGFAKLIEITSDIIISVIPPLVSGLGFVIKNIDTLTASMSAAVIAFQTIKAVKAWGEAVEAAGIASKVSAAALELKTAAAQKNAVVEALQATAVEKGTIAETLRIAAKKAGLAVDEAGNLITAKGVIVTEAEAAALVKSSTAMSAKSVIVGLLTGNVTLYTAAQWLANAAATAFPVVAIVAGAAALAAGIVTLVKWINRESEEQKILNEETEKLTDSYGKLTDSVASSKQLYDDKINSMELELGVTQKLSDEIYALAENENKSAEEKTRLSILVDQLNASMDGLNLQYDEEAGLLSKTQEEINGIINAKREEFKARAAQERAIEISKQQLEVEEQLKKIAAEKAKWFEAYENGEVKAKAYANALRELEEQENTLAGQNEELSDSYKTMESIVVESMTKQKEASAELMDQFTEAQRVQDQIVMERKAQEDELTAKMIESANAQGLTLEEYKEDLESFNETLKKYTDAALNMFSKLGSESELSVVEMTENLEHNQRTIEEWSGNIAKLAERGIDEGLLATLREAGPESAGEVKNLVSASDEELDKLSDVFSNGAEVAVKALREQLGLPDVVNSGSDMVDDIAKGVSTNASLSDATEQLIVDTKNKASKQITISNFVEIGTQIVTGIIQGINNSKSNLFSAVNNMLVATKEIARKTIDAHSPSKVFEDEIGAMIAEGTAQGIDKNSEKAKKAAQKMATEVFKKAKIWIDDYRNSSDYLISEEQKMWQYLSTIYTDVSKEKVEIDKNINKLQLELIKEREAVEKESFEFSKNWIESKKNLGLLSMQEEVEGWERVSARYAEGTELRQRADEALYKARQQYIKEAEKNIESIAKAEEKYQKAIEDRTEAIFKSFVKFEDVSKLQEKSTKAYEDAASQVEKLKEEIIKLDEERVKENLTTQRINKLNEEYAKKQQELSEATRNLTKAQAEASKSQKQIMMDSLTEQVRSLEEWASSIESLSRRGIDEGLLKELSKMGPSAQADMEALNSMTDSELARYQDTWKRGYAIAHRYAVEELSEMRIETNNEIKALTSDLMQIMSSDSRTMAQMLAEGFWNGLTDSNLRERVQSYFQDLVNDVQVDIMEEHSPSRRFARIGKHAGEGFINGIIGTASAIDKTMEKVFGSFEDSHIGFDFDSSGSPLSAVKTILNPISEGQRQTPFTYSPINNFYVDNELDIQRVSRELSRQTENAMRSKGLIWV